MAGWDLPNKVAPVQTFNARNSTFTNNNPAGTGTALNNYYFNPNDFVVATLGTIGDAGRNPFHGPGLNNMDIEFAKDTKITESTRQGFDLKPTTSSITPSSSTLNPKSTGIVGDCPLLSLWRH